MSHSTRMRAPHHLARLAWLLAFPPIALPVAPAANAQGTNSPTSLSGDGRVHAPAPIEVGYASLKPDQVETIVLHPFMTIVLVYPYPVGTAFAGDPGTFQAMHVGNSLMLKTKDCVQGCSTDLLVYLDDGLGTIVPYFLVVDTTRTVTLKRVYTDPLATRYHARVAAVTDSLSARADRAVTDRLAAAVERCVAAGFTFTPINASGAWLNSGTGESIGITVQDVGESGSCLGAPHSYVRYTIDNAQYASLGPVQFRVNRRRAGAHTAEAVPILRDAQDPSTVPPLRRVRGQLVLAGPLSLEPGDELSISAIAGGHPIDLGTVLRRGTNEVHHE